MMMMMMIIIIIIITCVECESSSDTGINRVNWNSFKIIQKIPDKAPFQGTKKKKKKTSHIGQC
jgi:hypothetical protein